MVRGQADWNGCLRGDGAARSADGRVMQVEMTGQDEPRNRLAY